MSHSSRIYLLYFNALTLFAADVGWFLTHGYFAPNVAAAIHDEVGKLCAGVRKNVEFYVDSLGVPEHLVHAPIAADWQQHYAYTNTVARL